MAVFARVVERGGFSGAARDLGISPSAVSKLMSRLEARLGTKLLRRSTRSLALTTEGEEFLSRSLTILAEIDAAERAAGGARLPSGRVRISSSASYAAHVLAPLLPDFLATYPDISIDILQSDSVSDLITDGADLAIRAGPLASSNLIARPLGETELMVVASPSWIARNGIPESLDELAACDSLSFSYRRADGGWLELIGDVPSRVCVNDGEGMRQLALAGTAPARLAQFTIEADLAAGRLVPLLPDLLPPKTEAFHAVYVGRSSELPGRVRVMLDALTERGRVGNARVRSQV